MIDSERIEQILADAGLQRDPNIPVFTGDVTLSETVYDPDDAILQALRDAANAEFPCVVAVDVKPDGQTSVAVAGRNERGRLHVDVVAIEPSPEDAE